MGLPSPTLVSPTFKQLAIAIWNVFPLWLALLQAALPPLLGPALRRHRWTPTPTSALRLVYAVIALAVAGAHAGALTVAACSALFPTLFVNPALLSPARLFVPPTGAAPAPTVGDGVRGFMLWDQAAGYATMLFLACVALREAVKEKKRKSESAGVSVLQLLGMAVGGSVVVGPGCTVLALQWARDEVERKKGKDK